MQSVGFVFSISLGISEQKEAELVCMRMSREGLAKHVTNFRKYTGSPILCGGHQTHLQRNSRLY